MVRTENVEEKSFQANCEELDMFFRTYGAWRCSATLAKSHSDAVHAARITCLKGAVLENR